MPLERLKRRIWTPAKSHFSLTARLAVTEEETESFCVQFDPEDKYFAVSSSAGSIRVYNTLSGKQMSSMLLTKDKGKTPVTSLR